MINTDISVLQYRQQEQVATGEQKKDSLWLSVQSMGLLSKGPLPQDCLENDMYCNELQGATSADNQL